MILTFRQMQPDPQCIKPFPKEAPTVQSPSGRTVAEIKNLLHLRAADGNASPQSRWKVFGAFFRSIFQSKGRVAHHPTSIGQLKSANQMLRTEQLYDSMGNRANQIWASSKCTIPIGALGPGMPSSAYSGFKQKDPWAK